MGIEVEPVHLPENIQQKEKPLANHTGFRGWGRRKKWVLGTTLTGMAVLGGGGYWANEYPDQAAELSRSIIGDENTAWIESKYLTLKDKKDQWKYEIFGGRENPFDENYIAVTNPQAVEPQTPDPQTTVPPSFSIEEPFIFMPPEIPKPKPMVLPETYTLLTTAPGEAFWAIDGLPRTSKDDVLMAKTYIRPDSTRPYASVGVLLLDKRRIKLNVMGGNQDPGKGPGRIPEEDLPNLLVAFNGGFQGGHGVWGMYANGAEYKKLQKGYASVVVMKDGTIKMGTWGEEGLTERTEDMVAVRQNCVLLVQNGEVTPAAKNQGTNNNVWGYVNVNSAEFITWRSAIGLTKEGNLIVAAGNSLSAKSLAEGLKAAGAEAAMQLDINAPYVQTDLFFLQPDGALTSSLFMETMSDKNSKRYLGPQNRDFMYITLDETNFKP